MRAASITVPLITALLEILLPVLTLRELSLLLNGRWHLCHLAVSCCLGLHERHLTLVFIHYLKVQKLYLKLASLTSTQDLLGHRDFPPPGSSLPSEPPPTFSPVPKTPLGGLYSSSSRLSFCSNETPLERKRTLN